MVSHLLALSIDPQHGDFGTHAAGAITYVSFSVADGSLKIYGDGDYKPSGLITKVTIYGLEDTVDVEGVKGAKAAFREDTKVLDIEGLELSLVGESSIQWQ